MLYEWCIRHGMFRVVDGGKTQGYFPTVRQAIAYIQHEQARRDQELLRVTALTWGVKFNMSAAWLGGHWSKWNRRLCFNILPCVTVWVAFPGGKRP